MSYFETRLAEIKANPSLVCPGPGAKAQKVLKPSRKQAIPSGTKEGLIYVVSAGPYVKIGYTQDVGARIADLQTGNPHPIYVMASFRSFREAEKMIHKRFKADHVAREWFNRSYEIEEFCDDILDYRGMRASDSLSSDDATGLELLAALDATLVTLEDLKFILDTIDEPWPASFPNRPFPRTGKGETE